MCTRQNFLVKRALSKALPSFTRLTSLSSRRKRRGQPKLNNEAEQIVKDADFDDAMIAKKSEGGGMLVLNFKC